MVFKMRGNPFKQNEAGVTRSKVLSEKQKSDIASPDHSALKKEMAADTNRPIDTITDAQLKNWLEMRDK